MFPLKKFRCVHGHETTLDNLVRYRGKKGLYECKDCLVDRENYAAQIKEVTKLSVELKKQPTLKDKVAWIFG